MAIKMKSSRVVHGVPGWTPSDDTVDQMKQSMIRLVSAAQQANHARDLVAKLDLYPCFSERESLARALDVMHWEEKRARAKIDQTVLLKKVIDLDIAPQKLLPPDIAKAIHSILDDDARKAKLVAEVWMRGRRRMIEKYKMGIIRRQRWARFWLLVRAMFFPFF